MLSKKYFKKELSASALLITLLILSGIFVIAFGVAYLGFLNTKGAEIYQQGSRARLVAEAGVERFKWERWHNFFDFYTQCGENILGNDLDENSNYYIECVEDDNSHFKVRAVGKYKKSSLILDTGYCYNINDDCHDDCAVGSLCGGGILVSKDLGLVVSPSACSDVGGSGCDNSFLSLDSQNLYWDNNATSTDTMAEDLDDGRNNIAYLLDSRYEAVQFCDQLSVNGYNDWYLPAINELNLILRNSNLCDLNVSGSEPNGCERGSGSDSYTVDGFSSNIYISSTEDSVDSNNGFFISFVDGSLISDLKYNSYLFRCVRRAY